MKMWSTPLIIRGILIKAKIKCHYKTIAIAKLFLNMIIVSPGKNIDQLKLSDFLWEM